MRSWNKNEDDILINSRVNLNLSYGEIAKRLVGRTRDAVRHRWDRLSEGDEVTEKLGDIMDKPKILVFDIETSPLTVYSWGVYQQYINPDNVIDDWFVISWAAKWLNDNMMMSEVLTPKEIKEKNDKRIVSKLWKLLDEADIVVAHNGDRFDKKRINWRFLVHGFPPPLSYKTVDTLKVARKYFGATSNKLDYLLKTLSIGAKTDTDGFELWKSCMEGNRSALKAMLEYNVNDVVTLEKIYLVVLPWITNHPNIGLYSTVEVNICPACGSNHIQRENKLITTSVNAYYQYRCLDCNHVGRTKEHATTKEKRRAMLSN